MTKPLLILDQHFRTKDELFSPETFAALTTRCRVEGGADEPMDAGVLNSLMPDATFLVAARPTLSRADLDRAPHLRASIEVSGAFHEELDYEACFDRGIEVLSCAPAFRRAVAEMGLAMILAGARGLVDEHEAFRAGEERWLDDRVGRDFSLHGQTVGFVGYGNIARELHRLLAPFEPKVEIHDPWLGDAPNGVAHQPLMRLFRGNRVVVVTAAPSAENRRSITADHIEAMPAGALLVLLGRAHVMDFEAALDAAKAGRITFATDVFPREPLAADDPLRRQSGVILSPHRAAAVEYGRRPIGDMIAHDVAAILDGRPERQLQPANRARVADLVEAQRTIEAAGTLSNT